ncbi:hypothetical protein, conserved [Babesia ovata]|uniref:Uncharacterized protein n=1 Tax=Babesia ovata TaxID=189622 RepID=A0A2H6KGH7_9APIC|nr:uncharacterized protein BOVATA_035950 [Babesia ovata]GBE62102.1 hypothetical protein, conserved [Babesia ovata]
MVYDSLTDAPHNLKECIDWLIALKGDDAENNFKAMGTAVHKFLEDKPVPSKHLPAIENFKHIFREFLRQQELKDLWYVEDMLEMINGPMNKKPEMFAKITGVVEESDYTNAVETRNAKPETIAKIIGDVLQATGKFLAHIKNPDHYNSAYSSNATWDASCENDPEACAVAFVGIALMLYAGLETLRDACVTAFFRCPPFLAYKRMQEVLNALGYVEPECRANMTISDVEWALSGVDNGLLNTLYNLASFWHLY